MRHGIVFPSRELRLQATLLQIKCLLIIITVRIRRMGKVIPLVVTQEDFVGDTLLMETGLLHDYFGNFSTQGERYYFYVEGSMRGEIEMKLGNRRWGGD